MCLKICYQISLMVGKEASPECSRVGFSPVWEWCCPLQPSHGTCLGKITDISAPLLILNLSAPLLMLKTNGLLSKSPHFFLFSWTCCVCDTALRVPYPEASGSSVCSPRLNTEGREKSGCVQYPACAWLFSRCWLSSDVSCRENTLVSP